MDVLAKLREKPTPAVFKPVNIKVVGTTIQGKKLFRQGEKLEDFLKRNHLPVAAAAAAPTPAEEEQDTRVPPAAAAAPAEEEQDTRAPHPPAAAAPAEEEQDTRAPPPPAPREKPIKKPVEEAVVAAVKKPAARRVKNMIRQAPPVTDLADDVSQLRQWMTKQTKAAASLPALYLNNRKLFIQKIDQWFQQIKNTYVANPDDPYDLLLHQTIVREYLGTQTPYRGLLLFHGLGSGKTCTSIAVAEGLKETKKIYLFIPASLETNFYGEIKKCGDVLYRKKQHWSFLNLASLDDSETAKQQYKDLLALLHVSAAAARKRGGVWLMNPYKPANYNDLSTAEQADIQDQLDSMIHEQYHQINYNASNLKQNLTQLAGKNNKNPFDHSVVIIDEVHKLISTIVNKINAKKKNETGPMLLYKLLLNAVDCRVVLLTGTPVVNYPNELSVLFNILRGHIKTWEIVITDSGAAGMPTRDRVLEMLVQGGNGHFDFVAVEGGRLRITRNPAGFVNQYAAVGGGATRRRRQQGGAGEWSRYKGVMFDPAAVSLTDDQFIKGVVKILTNKTNKLKLGDVSLTENKALPESLETFTTTFLDMSNLQRPAFLPRREIVFKKRILGLGSYFLPTDEKLLPTFVPAADGEVMHYTLCEMSDFQFEVYTATRLKEAEEARQRTQNRAQQKDTEVFANTYRIYSRCNCNYVFPMIDNKPGRPTPPKAGEAEADDANEEETSEELVDAETVNEDGEVTTNQKYKALIDAAIAYLTRDAPRYLEQQGLEIYSPKYLHILQNIKDPTNNGLHLVYSQFRTLEGIGLFRLVLLNNGYAELKLKSKKGAGGPAGWEIEWPDDLSLPRFLLYTGTETKEVREILRNIYNGDWDDLPADMQNQLRAINANNRYGEIVKIIMITGSAAEGINLKNTRFVHLMEPFWHYVRLQQVIGRARRYRSHMDLPAPERTVKVFLYMATFTAAQVDSIKKTVGEGVLIRAEASKREPEKLLTSDQALFEISLIKQQIADTLLQSVKEAAIDCRSHSQLGSCFNMGVVTSPDFSTKPTLEEDIIDSQGQEMQQRAVKKIKDRELYYYADDATRDRFPLYDSAAMTTQIGEYDKTNKKVVLAAAAAAPQPNREAGR
jgi:hypothetical protein